MVKWTKNIHGNYTVFIEKTNHFSYFRFLCTGKSYKVGELCFIGDTGWTSFKRDRKEVNKQEFNRLPENVFVKDFSCEKIIEMHNAWIEYANQMICKEKKLIILTHFPMVDFTETAYDCWWSSKTRFKIKKITGIYLVIRIIKSKKEIIAFLRNRVMMEIIMFHME